MPHLASSDIMGSIFKQAEAIHTPDSLGMFQMSWRLSWLSSILLKLQLWLLWIKKIPAMLSHILNRAQNKPCCTCAYTSSACDQTSIYIFLLTSLTSHHLIIFPRHGWPPPCLPRGWTCSHPHAHHQQGFIKVICFIFHLAGRWSSSGPEEQVLMRQL